MIGRTVRFLTVRLRIATDAGEASFCEEVAGVGRRTVVPLGRGALVGVCGVVGVGVGGTVGVGVGGTVGVGVGGTVGVGVGGKAVAVGPRIAVSAGRGRAEATAPSCAIARLTSPRGTRLTAAETREKGVGVPWPLEPVVPAAPAVPVVPAGTPGGAAV